MPQLIPALAQLNPALVIFDKDGTLIHFEAMWGAWAIDLAQKLEAITGRSMAERLYKALDFYADTGQIAPHGALSVTPMAGLRLLTIQVLVGDMGLSPAAAEAAVAKVWQTPDPVATAHPLADLDRLFAALRVHGLHIAVATSDDRAPTAATLAKLGLADFVAALACGDDGIPIKPEPDMVLTLCRTLGVLPAKTVVVGDNVADLQMGRAAGAGLVVGVLSGVSSAEILGPHADIVLPSVAGLVE
ncbi:MAG: HAD family hydrolase [Anaerolineae bacterium]|nr:HAD family hydrolase [Anaerolineae bacterium]